LGNEYKYAKNNQRRTPKVILPIHNKDLELSYVAMLCPHSQKSITHFHTYPKTPKMNAHRERLNRTLQEEFIDYNIDDLFNNITAFNTKFRSYLEFYNTKRVHHAFKNKYSPLEFMLQSNHYKINLPED